MSRYHEQYYEMNAGAHRKPASRIGAPALIRHIGVWIPGHHNGGPDDRHGRRAPSQFAQRREAWQNAIDGFIARGLANAFQAWPENRRLSGQQLSANMDKDHLILFRHKLHVTEAARNSGHFELQPLTEQEASSHESTYRIISLNLLWNDISTKIRFELHTEYLTASVHLDPTSRRLDPSSGYDERIGRLSRRGPRANPTSLSEMLAALESQLFNSEMRDGTTRDTARLRKISEPLCNDLWNEFDRDVVHEGVWRPAELGKIFADFRGVIVAEPNENYDLRERYSAADSRRLAERLVSFLESDQYAERMSRDYCASRFLDGRAIYASALGPQLPRSANADSDDGQVPPLLPLYYVVLTQIQDRRRVGRLVDRINTLGTLRLAALMDSQSLRKVGSRLRDAGVELDELTRVIHQTETGPTRHSLRLLNQRLRHLFVRVNSPSVDAENGQGRHDAIDGGVSYRVERARYYLKQFRELLPALRERRIEGYQPYEEFVIRRLSPSYDYVDRLGVRLDRAQARVRGLTDQVQALTLTDLQLMAEMFLWLIAAPYYFSHMVSACIVHFGWPIEDREFWSLLIPYVVFIPLALSRYRNLRGFPFSRRRR